MRGARLQELEGIAAKLLATARELPPGQERHNALREIGRFRAQIAALEGALRPSTPGAKGEGEMTEVRRFATRPWTRADDEILRSLVLKGTDARGIGTRLNRTAVAVRSRARRLNIPLRNTGRKPYLG